MKNFIVFILITIMITSIYYIYTNYNLMFSEYNLHSIEDINSSYNNGLHQSNLDVQILQNKILYYSDMYSDLAIRQNEIDDDEKVLRDLLKSLGYDVDNKTYYVINFVDADFSINSDLKIGYYIAEFHEEIVLSDYYSLYDYDVIGFSYTSDVNDLIEDSTIVISSDLKLYPIVRSV